MLVFPPPLGAPVEQFVKQCQSLMKGDEESLSDKFLTLLRSSQAPVSGNARGLLTNLAQFAENKVLSALSDASKCY